MISSQCSAQSVAILPGATETETKRIVPLRGSASGSDPPKIIAGSGTPPPDKNPTERNITSYLQGVGCDPGYWPVISLLASTEDHAWERSPDTGRLEGSNPVQSVHWRPITRRVKGSETRECKSGSRRYQLTFDGYSLPYGCEFAGYNICGFV